MQASSKFSKAIHICIYLNVTIDHMVTSGELAESLMTNPVVVRQLVGLLKGKKILKTIAGPSGGIFLAKSPDQITLWKLYLSTREGALFKKPNRINPDCKVSSNLEVLLHDSLSLAELQLRDVLELQNIALLTQKLETIVGQKTLKEGK